MQKGNGGPSFFGRLTTSKAVYVIIIIGIIIYFNSLLNGFVLDDATQIVQSTNIHSIKNIVSFFQGSTFNYPVNNAHQLTGVYYKPVLLTFFSIIYTVFGANAFYFHLLQLLLHIANTVMVFLFFSFFFKKQFSIFLSLIFLIHPINTESVVYISSLQDVLFFFFGMIALVTLAKTKVLQTYKQCIFYLLIFFLMLFSLLSKETGVIFIFVLPFFAFLFKKRNVKFIAITVGLSLVAYFILRFFVGHVYFNITGISNISELPLSQRLISVPKILFYYIQTFFVPLNLFTAQGWVVKDFTIQDFYLPLTVDGIFCISLLGLGTFIWNKEKAFINTYLFFLMWFLVGLCFHLQIIPLDQTVADRWFYFSIVGLLGLSGLLIQLLLAKSRRIFIIATLIGFFIIAIFSLRTLIRNIDWYTNYSLTSHDILFEENSEFMQNALGLELLKMGKYNEAENHFQLSYQLSPQSAILSNLALAYGREGNFTKSEETYYKLIKVDKQYFLAYINLSYFQLKSNKPQIAEETARQGLALFPDETKLWILLSFAQYKMGNYQQAVESINKAYNLSPTDTKQIHDMIVNHLPIDSYL